MHLLIQWIYVYLCIYIYIYIYISDHHAIFHIEDKYIPEKDQFQLIRLCNEQRMNDYKDSICNIDWSILDEYKTSEAYFSHFLKMFKSVYDKVFPVIKV